MSTDVRNIMTSISAGHLEDKDDENEGWGEIPMPKDSTPVLNKRLDDEDLEKELAGEKPVESNPKDDDTVLKQIDQIQVNLPNALAALEQKIESIKQQQKALIEEEQAVKSRINFLRKMNGQDPLEETKPKRKGGRRPAPLDAAALTAAILPRTEAEEPLLAEGEERPKGRGGRGKRHKNPLTLKQCVCKALFNMTHPTTHQKYTGNVNDVTLKVMTKVEDGGYGYRSTAGSKLTNTVRIQMHRLHDDKLLVQNQDGSYTLCEELVNKLLEASKTN